jgi:putative membrane protein
MGRGSGTMYGYGGLPIWLFLIVIAAIIAFGFWRGSKGRASMKGFDKDEPLNILKRRYARGEISKEDFEKKKKDLED